MLRPSRQTVGSLYKKGRFSRPVPLRVAKNLRSGKLGEWELGRLGVPDLELVSVEAEETVHSLISDSMSSTRSPLMGSSLFSVGYLVSERRGPELGQFERKAASDPVTDRPHVGKVAETSSPATGLLDVSVNCLDGCRG